MFKKCGSAQFDGAISSKGSKPFREHFERLCDLSYFIDRDGAIAYAQSRADTSFKPPASCTMVVGDLAVDGIVDLGPGTDEPGLFIVLGNLRCHSLIGGDHVIILIDGDLTAQDAVVNGFEHASLSVMGTLRTKLFIGEDVWAMVGGKAVMEYGDGYCLPLDYDDAEVEAIRPVNGKSETIAVVSLPPRPRGYFLSSDAFANRLRAAQPIFK